MVRHKTEGEQSHHRAFRRIGQRRKKPEVIRGIAEDLGPAIATIEYVLRDPVGTQAIWSRHAVGQSIRLPLRRPREKEAGTFVGKCQPPFLGVQPPRGL